MPGSGQRGGDRAQDLVAAIFHDGAEGLDTLTYLDGPDVYVLHVGAGLPAAEARRSSLEVAVPAVLLERTCWLTALALEHDDARRAGG